MKCVEIAGAPEKTGNLIVRLRRKRLLVSFNGTLPFLPLALRGEGQNGKASLLVFFEFKCIWKTWYSWHPSLERMTFSSKGLLFDTYLIYILYAQQTQTQAKWTLKSTVGLKGQKCEQQCTGFALQIACVAKLRDLVDPKSKALCHSHRSELFKSFQIHWYRMSLRIQGILIPSHWPKDEISRVYCTWRSHLGKQNILMADASSCSPVR